MGGWVVRGGLALLMVGCPKVPPEPEVPPIDWSEPEPPPPPEPSDLDGNYLALVEGDLAWVDLTGDDAAAVAADAVAQGRSARGGVSLPPEDPELARWVARGVLGTTEVRLHALPDAPGEGVSRPARLVGAEVVEVAGEGVLRAWFRLPGEPVEPGWRVLRADREPVEGVRARAAEWRVEPYEPVARVDGLLVVQHTGAEATEVCLARVPAVGEALAPTRCTRGHPRR